MAAPCCSLLCDSRGRLYVTIISGGICSGVRVDQVSRWMSICTCLLLWTWHWTRCGWNEWAGERWSFRCVLVACVISGRILGSLFIQPQRSLCVQDTSGSVCFHIVVVARLRDWRSVIFYLALSHTLSLMSAPTNNAIQIVDPGAIKTPSPTENRSLYPGKRSTG